MPKHPREKGSLLPASLAGVMLISCALGGLTGCMLFPDPELRQLRQVSDCRWNARRACHQLAKETETQDLDIDECVSDRAWSCSIGDAEDSDSPPADDDGKDADQPDSSADDRSQ